MFLFFLDHYKEDTNEVIEIGKNRIGVIGFVDGVGDDYDEDKGNRNVKNKSKKTIWEKGLVGYLVTSIRPQTNCRLEKNLSLFIFVVIYEHLKPPKAFKGNADYG